MVLLFLIVIAELTDSARPPPLPPDPATAPSAMYPEPAPPLPPMPTINPLFINSTPPGNDPFTVNAGVPVELLLTNTPLLIVAITLMVWFHPALTAKVRRFALVVLLAIVNEKALALP
jgi:hypothetical protein